MTTLDEPVAPAKSRKRSPDRAELIADAAIYWADELAALGGRNPLLNFRDLKVGTLDLAAAEPEARKRMLDGESTTVTRLFPHEPLRSSALRSVKGIRDKARELSEERGLAACVLAVGIATWADPFSAHRPTAPVLLRAATVTARDAAETDFVIEMAEEPEVNPVLTRALNQQLGLRFDVDDLHDSSGALRYSVVVEKMREIAPAHVVDGFSIAHRAVLGTFTKEPLALSLDIEALGPALQRNDIVAMLAGDTNAPTSSTTYSSHAAKNLVLDADWRQHAVVTTAAAGSHLRVNAPAGTGRTQTIANLVAELVGRGKSVLVVGIKQARLRELVGRLARVGLDDVVLDLSDGRTYSSNAVRRVAEVAQRVADETKTAPDPEQLPSEEQLRDYCEVLHRPREPWGTSAYEAMVAVVDAPAQVRTAATIPIDATERLEDAALELIRAHLREYADLEGLSLSENDSAWYNSTVPTRLDAEFLAGTVIDLKEAGLPVLRDTATRAAVEVGLVGPQTTAECFATVTLLNTVGSTLDRFRPEIWAAPLDDMVTATATGRLRSLLGPSIGVLASRRLRGEARELLRDPRDRAALHEALREARDQLAAWRERARDGGQPRIGAHLTSANIALEAVGERLATLIEANPRAAELANMPFPEAAELLSTLAADEQHLLAIPRLSELAAEFSAAGLDDLIGVLREWRVGPEHVAEAFDYARNRSLLEAWRDEEPVLRSFDPVEHDRLVEAFRTADPGVVRSAVARVRAARARRYAEVAEEHAGQAAVVESGEPGPRTPRELLVAAPDVALAAVPCWVMSPLVVANVLPARQLFDVVIVEQAGRLPVAQAVPALARAGQVVVVGDEMELTAAPFTTAVEPNVEPDEAPLHPAEKPAPSVFDALGARLPGATLATHYRARDDRLVGFPARVAYRGGLAAVPGVRGPSPLHHELVDVTSGEEPVDSATAEVARVVEMVLKHARTRRHQSLGVITVGSHHAGRIDDALRRALVRSPDAARFIREDREEPFFVKDVERAVGDVRDAVILSVGYGRSVDGRVVYRFGTLDKPGGNRLLTAAISAARERLTVVSAFTFHDLSPRRLTTAGAQALREFLVYVESSSDGFDAHAPVDSLDAVIADRLFAAGVDVVIGHGSPGARIPLAARHPSRKDRLVLAVETDGPTYSAQPTVRDRDRLYPEHLTRLGWAVHRVWSTAWLDDPNREIEQLLSAYERAVSVADAYDWAEAAAQADDVVGMPDDETSRESPAAEKPAAADDQTPEPEDPPAQSSVAERGPRPRIRAGQPIGGYTRQELAALARWVESDGRARTEAEAITEIAHELDLPDRAPRAEDSLRHAVRVARAGAPPLWPDEFEAPPKDEAAGAEAEPGPEPEAESETTD